MRCGTGGRNAKVGEPDVVMRTQQEILRFDVTVDSGSADGCAGTATHERSAPEQEGDQREAEQPSERSSEELLRGRKHLIAYGAKVVGWYLHRH